MRRRPFKPFSHHAPAQIKAALQSKAAMSRAVSPVPTATHEQHQAAIPHPNLAKRQLLPLAPMAFLPFKVRDATALPRSPRLIFAYQNVC